jgi:hypothetical protein
MANEESIYLGASGVNPRTFNYSELLEFMNIWKSDLEKCRKKQDFSRLGKFFTDDCVFNYTQFGHNSEYLRPNPFEVVGPKGIVDAIQAGNLLGLNGWSYPWFFYVIDPRKANILYFYQAVSPYEKEDGTFFKTATTGITRLHYAGSYQIDYIDDLYDYEYQHDLEEELVIRRIAPPNMVARVDANNARMEEDRKKFKAYTAELRRLRPEYQARFGEQIKRETAPRKK